MCHIGILPGKQLKRNFEYLEIATEMYYEHHRCILRPLIMCQQILLNLILHFFFTHSSFPESAGNLQSEIAIRKRVNALDCTTNRPFSFCRAVMQRTIGHADRGKYLHCQHLAQLFQQIAYA